jgi:hypothetical protein
MIFNLHKVKEMIGHPYLKKLIHPCANSDSLSSERLEATTYVAYIIC